MLWHCKDCTTAYSVGAPRCPHCGSTDYTEDAMPKIHADGRGVTDAADLTDGEHEVPGDGEPREGATVELGQEAELVSGGNGDAQPALELPARNASKADWVDAAVARGWDRGDAEKLNRDDLAAALNHEEEAEASSEQGD